MEGRTSSRDQRNSNRPLRQSRLRCLPRSGRDSKGEESGGQDERDELVGERCILPRLGVTSWPSSLSSQEEKLGVVLGYLRRQEL